MAGGLSAVSAAAGQNSEVDSFTRHVAADGNMTVLKHSSIVVRVEEALADLLVVSYRPHDAAPALYQGVLLHSNKTSLPYGVHSLHPAFLMQGKGDVNEDRLHSVSQRFTYLDAQYPPAPAPAVLGKSKPRARQKMTVRLRPRKVLCSKCKGICNENSENVNTSPKRSTAARATSPFVSDEEKKFLRGHSLIPKLSRLQPSEISAATAPRVRPVTVEQVCAPSVTDTGSCDLEDTTTAERPPTAFGSVFSSARTLKICFGEGEGTVVKIPPIVGELNEDSGVSSDVGRAGGDTREVKRALKRARRLARRHKVKRKKRRHDDNAEEEGEEVPEFPAAAESEVSCEGGGGDGDDGARDDTVQEGDVVWGKLAGFPWWPARVLGVQAARAHVAWYACATTSNVHLHHLSPFLLHYNVHFNKKKRGTYKEAVRLASEQARRAPSPLPATAASASTAAATYSAARM